ncbi:MAG: hypothetical protein ACOWWO_19480 [Peptococcaceae bacterium]
MKRVLVILLILFLVLGSSTGVMAKSPQFNNTGGGIEQEISEYGFEYSFPEEIIVGETVKAAVTLKTKEVGKSGYENARILFSVTSTVLDDEEEVIFSGKDKNNDIYTYKLEDGREVVWGPSSFELNADYEAVTPWEITFPKPGIYDITFKVVDPTSSKNSADYLIAREAKTVIVEPLMLKGFVKEKKISGTYYELNGYRLTGDYDFADYKGEFIIVEGYRDISPAIYMVESFCVEDLEKLNEGEKVKLRGKIEKIAVKNTSDYYTLESCRLVETSVYDTEDFEACYNQETLVEVEGTVDEDDQGIKVWGIKDLTLNDDNNGDKDDNGYKNRYENVKYIKNGNVHGLVNALRNHLKAHNQGNTKLFKSTQRIMELLQARGYDLEKLKGICKN